MSGGWQPGRPGPGEPTTAPEAAWHPGQPPHLTPSWQPGGPSRRGHRPLLLALVAVIVVALCGIGVTGGYLYLHRSPGRHGGGSAQLGDHPARSAGLGKGWQAATSGAGHKLEIFEDFGCPNCKTASQQIQPTIDTLISDHHGEWDIRYFPVAFTGAPAKRDANAFACSTVDGTDVRTTLGYLHTMFGKQGSDEATGPSNEELIGLAPAKLRADPTFQRCVRNDSYGSWVASMTTTMQDRDISGVPAVFVDGKQLAQSDLSKAGFAAAVGS